MILNGTNHVVQIYDYSNLIAKNRFANVYSLISEDILPKKMINQSFSTPLTVRKNSYDYYIEEDGVGFKNPMHLVTSIDPIPTNVNLQEDVVIVSEMYAKIAKQVFPKEWLDILYTVTDIVEDEQEKILGCANLRRVANYELPSFYCNPKANKLTRRHAYTYWLANSYYLNAYELNCLQFLKMYLDQELQ